MEAGGSCSKGGVEGAVGSLAVYIDDVNTRISTDSYPAWDILFLWPRTGSGPCRAKLHC